MPSLAQKPAFAPSGFFVLRAPLLPFCGSAAGEAGPCGDRARLRDLLARPDVRDAVYVASPSLEGNVDLWLREPESEAGRKVEQALRRYAARMTGRATPFGLFAGCAVGTVGRATRLEVAGPCRRHTRLDMDYVVTLADGLANDPALRPSLRFALNSSLYRVAGRARYREVRRAEAGWSHHRASLEVPDYLEAVLARAEGGATPAELVRALLDHDPGATEAEAAEYVADLIGQQVLVSELVPAVTGPEPVHRLIERLREAPAGAAAADRLAWVRDELAAIDAEGPGAAPDRYRAMAAWLGHLPAEADPSRLLQVDLVRSGAGVVLGENVVAELLRGVELLRRLTPRPVVDPLAEFRRAFADRFGDTPVTREVPLAEALDDETGVGFADDRETVEASSLLEGLDLSPPPESRVPWGARETHLLGRLTETLARGELEMVLSDRDVEKLSVRDPLPLPDAFAAMARLEAASGEAAARGDFRLLLTGANGPSGARLLGRFCHGDPALAAAVADHVRAEEALRPDVAFAEIVHLPEGRLGNILARPTCRDYEILYLGRSGAPAERQIPLSDLRVSVVGERIVLRSARLRREVAPRLTSAHNFAAGQGVYRFLCALQAQGVAEAVGWDWGALSGSAFLPRVTIGRLVLSRATWRVTPAEATALLAGDAGSRGPAAARWRAERRLPRWVCLVESDHELPVDLDDAFGVEAVLDQARRREGATLCELFPAPDRLCASGPEGRYVHELVVPFVRLADAAAPSRGEDASPAGNGRAPGARPAPAPPPCRRRFAPGSEWSSVKLYAGALGVERLLRDGIGSLAARLVSDGAVRRWFFVRYADPHGHLRLRLEGDPDRLRAEAWPAVEAAVAPLVSGGLVWRVQLDTYEREVERYGGPAGIGACEALFHGDSEAVVELLRLLEDDGRGDRRWRTALLGMDRLLDDLGLDLERKHVVARLSRDAFAAEHRADGPAAGRLGAKYRVESASIADLLGDGDSAAWSETRAVLDRRRERSAAAVGALARATLDGRLSCSVDDLAQSLLHMHANRLLRSAHRAQERVLYDFLCRHYEGRLARRAPRTAPAATPS